MRTDAPTSESSDGTHFGLGRRDLWVLVGFVLTIFCADRLLDSSPYGVYLPNEHPQNQVQLLAQRLRPEPPDVLVIGSSRVEAAVAPADIAAAMVTPAGSPSVARLPVMGMRALMLHQVVRDLVLPKPPNRLLVLGLEERYFFPLQGETDDQLGLRLMGSSRDLLVVPPWHLRPADWGAFATVPLRGVRAFWELDRIFDPTLQPYLEHLWATGGLAEHNFREFSRADLALAVELAQRRPAPPRGTGPVLLESECIAFARTLDLLDTLRCDVVFVRMPVARAYDREHEAELAAFEQRVVRDVLERGHTYVDLNRISVLRADGLLANPTHSNTYGRAAASRALGLVLGVLTDRDSPFAEPRRRSLEQVLESEGLSLRPADAEIDPATLAAIETAVSEEARARAESLSPAELVRGDGASGPGLGQRPR